MIARHVVVPLAIVLAAFGTAQALPGYGHVRGFGGNLHVDRQRAALSQSRVSNVRKQVASGMSGTTEMEPDV